MLIVTRNWAAFRVGLVVSTLMIGAGCTSSETTAGTAPTLSLTATASSVNTGSSTSIIWSTTDATSCQATDAWSGSKATSGTEQVGPLNADSTFSLTCDGPDGSVSDSVTVTVTAATPAPVVTFTATPSSVPTGTNTQLDWSATNGTSCTASGGWTGNKGASGSEAVGPLNTNTTFDLDCSGPGGSGSASVSVTVTAAGAPVLTLSANPTSVASGGTSTITWSTSNVTSCDAQGAWSGSLPVNGSELVGPLTANSSFTLTCQGAGGLINRTVMVTVAPAGNAQLQGNVDSSLVDRFGGNNVYIYTGNVTPDDLGGAGAQPVLVAPVLQAENACTFSFAANQLADGDYTLAFTNEGDNDDPNQNDSIQFGSTELVTVAGAQTAQDFVAANILRVGPTRQYNTLVQAEAAAQDGDVIEIDAGVYVDDIVIWRQNNLTLRGVGGLAHMRADNEIPFVSGDDQRNGMGIWVTRGDSIRVENIEFSGSRVPDENGAGIRMQSQDLTICGSYLHDNENGVLGGAYGTLLIEYTEFDNNGLGDFGRTHNIYVDDGEVFIIRHSYSHNANIGHQIKTRAEENYILYNRAMDQVSGNASYAIDIPNGGLSFIIGNLLQQSPNADNASIVNYGTEGLSGGRTHELYVVNNTVVNDRGSGNFFQIQNGVSSVSLINNLLVGNGSVFNSATGTQTNDISTTAPGLVDQSGFDYRLTTNSLAVDAGTDPGSAQGVDLTPVYQYVFPTHREQRTQQGSAIDVGAYEYTP